MTTPEPEEPRRDVPAADRDIHIRVKLATTDPSLRPRAAVYQVILDRLTLLLRSSALGLDDADMAARRRYVADAPALYGRATAVGRGHRGGACAAP